MTRCGSCGAENPPGAAFCGVCNGFLEWNDDEPGSGPASASAGPTPPSAAPPPVPSPDVPAALPTPAESLPDPGQQAAEEEPSPEPERPTTVEPEPPLRPSRDPTPGVQKVIAALDASRELASGSGRSDLDGHLSRTHERLRGDPVPVVVLGEFKQGKSTLVNALLQSAVCPVDADVVTAVPTLIRYASAPRITTFVVDEDGGRSQEQDMPLDALPGLVTEQADPAAPGRQRSVEVGLPHRMLRSGLVLVDTPGVGGLDSAHGFHTLGALRHAEGVLFVTDASQELSAPELEFLRTAAQRCTRIAMVLTKVDLYPQWRRILELNSGHLIRADLQVPIIPVSSFLRLRAAQDPELNAESGFAELVAFLARDVVGDARQAAARVAAVEVEFVATQLAQQSAAERAVIEAPEQTAAVVAELDTVKEQATRLASPTATWQQTLGDGIQDLVADVEHDLQSRLRAVLKEAEEVIDQGDPQDSWEQTEAWLRRNVAIATLSNQDLLIERAEELARSVAIQFSMPEGNGLVLELQAADDAAEAVSLAPASGFTMPGGRLAPFLAAARSSFYLPVLAGGVTTAFPVVGLVLTGVAGVVGTIIGRQIIKDEKLRRLTYAQQQAKLAARRFVDDVAFRVNKQSRDGLRATQRRLRDDFQERALLLERSAAQALAAVRRVGALDDESKRDRGDELVDQGRRLAAVRSVARGVAQERAA